MAATMKARPTTYKGIEMRSRLEAGYAQWLDTVNITWEYEPTCFGSDRGQYLPDFQLRDVRIVGVGPCDFYVECKPFEPDWDEMRRALAVIRANTERGLFLVTWPGTTWMLLDNGHDGCPVHWIICGKDTYDGYWRGADGS
jgi:hypothetical protein